MAGGRWALVSPDGVAPSRMVGVSASVNLPVHHKVQKFSSGTGSPGWSRKKGRKTVVVCGGGLLADHSYPLHNQLLSHYRSHKASSNFNPKIGCHGNDT